MNPDPGDEATGAFESSHAQAGHGRDGWRSAPPQENGLRGYCPAPRLQLQDRGRAEQSRRSDGRAR